MAIEVVLPALGLTVEKGTILKWFKKEGDVVTKGESLFEVEADKVTTEVESPASGILKKILVSEGIEVPILTVVAVITDKGEELPEKYKSMEIKAPEIRKETVRVEIKETEGPFLSGEIKAVPAARQLAREKGITLSSIKGTGPGGTILLRDVETYLKGKEQVTPKILATPTARKMAQKEAIPITMIKGTGISGRIMKEDVIRAKSELEKKEEKVIPPSEKPIPKYQLGQIIKMNSMRKAIAKRMVQSKFTAPHIYFYNDVDMGKLISLRDEIVTEIEKQEGIRISINDFIIKAVALTLKEFPLLNSMVSGEEIKIFPEINVGLAVALEDGLIVPAIPKTDQLGIVEIARFRADLVERARNGKLKMEEIERGTFTISSLAQYDIVFFTAILNPPQSGILTLGKVEEKPSVRNGEIVIKKVMRQGLSVDHRIIDGAIAAQFLQSLKKRLENPLVTFLL